MTHRDVEPGNVMVTADRPPLIDGTRRGCTALGLEAAQAMGEFARRGAAIPEERGPRELDAVERPAAERSAEMPALFACCGPTGPATTHTAVRGDTPERLVSLLSGRAWTLCGR